MKKHIFLILILFAIPALVFPVTEDGITITKLSMDPIPFNERRDPASDSPYNAFDGDVKTSALYSDFTIEFSKPAAIDQIKIMNGNAAGRDLFKRDNRERDIEITLYAASVKPDRKTEKKSNKSKTAKPVKKDGKKPSAKEKDIKGKSEPDKTEKEKLEKEKIEKDKIEKEKIEEEKKKIPTPVEVIRGDEYDTLKVVRYDDVMLYFAASETVIEPEKKASADIKTEEVKKKETKNGVKKDDKSKTPVKSASTEKKTAEKKKTDTKKTGNVKGKTSADKNKSKNEIKKASTKPAVTSEQKKEKTPDKNIIEITDSKKDNKKSETPVTAEDKKSKEPEKKVTTETQKKEIDETEIKKSLTAEDKTINKTADIPAKKTSSNKNIKTVKKESSKKTAAKSTDKKAVKSGTAKKPPVKNVSEKKETDKKKIGLADTKTKTDNKKTSPDKKSAEAGKTVKPENEKKEADKTKIEITDSRNKTVKDKTPADKKNAEDKKAVKPETGKNAAEKITVKPAAEKKKEPVKDVKKEIKKEDAKQAVVNKPVEDVKVNKMKGIVRIENDKAGRVLVYASLKDSMEFQTIDLKGEYAVTRIDFRTRDDEYYAGTVPDRSAVSEITFLNNGKKVPVQGIDAMKKSYIERYSKNLSDSLSGETFIMYENNDVALRMTFRKDGKMEFFDRFKCSKRGDADCTYLSMPDQWRVADGRLQMRYHTIWRVWKYELDSQNDMLNDSEQPVPPRWMKIYFKSDNGFTDKYLELYRSEKGIWAE